jgi:hypothetical protein
MKSSHSSHASSVRTFVGYDRHESQAEEGLLNRLCLAPHLMANWFLPSQKLLHKERTGSHITKAYDTVQTLCARMLARKDVAAETKQRLLATRAELDITSLLHEMFVCQEQLDQIAKKRQPLVIKKRGSYATISGEFTT